MIKLTNRQQFNTFCILSNHGNDKTDMIKLTNRQQFNTFCILSNHGNDIKTFKTHDAIYHFLTRLGMQSL